MPASSSATSRPACLVSADEKKKKKFTLILLEPNSNDATIARRQKHTSAALLNMLLTGYSVATNVLAEPIQYTVCAETSLYHTCPSIL